MNDAAPIEFTTEEHAAGILNTLLHAGPDDRTHQLAAWTAFAEAGHAGRILGDAEPWLDALALAAGRCRYVLAEMMPGPELKLVFEQIRDGLKECC